MISIEGRDRGMWGRYGRVGGRDTHGDFDHEGAFLLFEKRAGGEGREHVGKEGGRQGSRSGLLKIVGSRAVMHSDGKVRACRPREWGARARWATSGEEQEENGAQLSFLPNVLLTKDAQDGTRRATRRHIHHERDNRTTRTASRQIRREDTACRDELA